MDDDLLARLLVTVASPDDGRRTAAALARYAGQVGTVVGVSVVKKAGGAPDRASVEQATDHGERGVAALADGLAGTGVDVDTRVVYGTDVVERIVATAHEEDATAIAFTPREGGGLRRLLTGNVATRLVHESDLPVVSLPPSDVAGDDEPSG